jgi:hypothetical protein
MSRNLLLLLGFVFSLNLPAQEKWELRKNTDGIAVYTRASAAEVYKEIRVVCELPGTPAQLIHVLKEVERHPEWVYLNRKTVLVQKKSANRFIYYTEADMPWPLTDRDMVVEATYFPEAKNRSVHVEVKSVPTLLPEKEDYVRIPSSLAVWDITPLPNQRIKVEYTFRVNPGGSVPAWAVNATVASGPVSTFQNLRKRLANQN